MKKIIEDAANDIHIEPPSANDPHDTNATFHGESSESTSNATFQGEHSTPQETHESPLQGENPTPEEETFTSFEGEKDNMNDDLDVHNDDLDIQLEFEDINDELDPSYDPNYPPLTKWTRNNPKTQVIGELSSGVLTRAQQKTKRSALLSKVEYCMFNSFITKSTLR